MRRIVRRWVALVVLVQFASASSTALADPLLTKFIGSWGGAGQVARSYEARLQKVKCRADVQTDDSDSELLVEGFCVVSSGRSKFSMRAVVDRDNVVLAGARAQGFDDTAQLAGTLTLGLLDLTTREPVSHNGQLFHLRMIFELGEEQRLRISQQVRPDGSDKSREIFLITMDRIPVKP